MTSVSAGELTAKIIRYLGIGEGQRFDLLKLKDGSVLLRKAES